MINEDVKIRIAGVIRESIVDGPGFRFVVFSQGCPHNCKGCHNSDTHDFNGGKDVNILKIIEEVDKDALLQGVTFSGGEPFCQATAFLALAREVKKRDLDIVIFTGYTYEEIMTMEDEDSKMLLEICDILIDGRFNEREKDLTLMFRGSRNQRIIDIKSTKKEGEIVLAEKYM